MPRDPAARPVTTGYAPLFGAPPPPIHEDRVHVYSKHMQMTLPSFGEAFAIAPPPAAAATQDRGPMPPLSPGPPLRGYAAEPLLPASAATSANFGATTGRSSPVPETKQEAYEREYEEMMRNIRARSATKGEAFAEEEDRRMEQAQMRRNRVDCSKRHSGNSDIRPFARYSQASVRQYLY